MLPRDVPGFQRESLDRLANQETGAFVKTDNREPRVVRQSIEPSDLLHAGDERGVYLPDAPGLLEVRLKFVFFSMERASVCDKCSQ